jgi:hypothetical protein
MTDRRTLRLRKRASDPEGESLQLLIRQREVDALEKGRMQGYAEGYAAGQKEVPQAPANVTSATSLADLAYWQQQSQQRARIAAHYDYRVSVENGMGAEDCMLVLVECTVHGEVRGHPEQAWRYFREFRLWVHAIELQQSIDASLIATEWAERLWHMAEKWAEPISFHLEVADALHAAALRPEMSSLFVSFLRAVSSRMTQRRYSTNFF